MLGRKSFTFETPNVIDPGEQAPSRPTRKEGTMSGKTMDKKMPDDQSPSSERRRITSFNTTVLLDAKNGIDNISKPSQDNEQRLFSPRYSFSSGSSNYDADAIGDEGYGDEDLIDEEHQAINTAAVASKLDQEYGEMDDDAFDRAVHDQLPSVEEARMFAATILQETDRRSNASLSPLGIARKDRSLKSLFASRKREDTTGSYNIQGGLVRTKPVPLPGNKHSRKMCRKWLMYIVLVSIAVVFVVSAASGIRSRAGGRGTERFNQLRAYILSQQVSSEEDMRTRNSPQLLAALWIADEDPLRLLIPDDNEAGIDATHLMQRYILAVFYYALGGGNWDQFLNFLTGEHECGWFRVVTEDAESGLADGRANTDYRYDQSTIANGVICDNNLQVRNLIIPSNNMGGTIPNEISFLKHVDVINFSGNNIFGAIPETIGQLELLRYLDFNFNQLTGSIPESLSSLENLEILGLSHNVLEGKIPDAMAFLGRIQTLAIDNNLLTGDIAPLFGMTRVKYLYADHNKLEADNNRLKPFSDLNDIIELDLSSNDLNLSSDGAFLPSSLFDRPHLKVLDLSRNKLGGQLPENLALNTKLEFLSLRSTSTAGRIPTSISNLRALTHLDLEDNSLEGAMPSAIGAMEDLSYLFMGRNSFTESPIPPEYERLSNLLELSLDGTQRTGRIELWSVYSWPKLKLLDLRNNQLTGTIPSDFGELSAMVFLLLSNNSLSGSVPDSFQSMTELSMVAIHNNDFTGDTTDTLCRDGEDALDLLTTDCSDIECSCCSTCCEEGNEECFSQLVWDRLEYQSASWEEHYGRPIDSYDGFDPALLDRENGADGQDTDF